MTSKIRFNYFLRALFVLYLASVFLLITAGCGGRKQRQRDPDPVAIAERSRTERAVSEYDLSPEERINLEEWATILDEPRTLDFIVVQVDDSPITYAEVAFLVEERLRRENRTDVSLAEKRRLFAGTLQTLIARKLIIAEAKELGYNIPDARVFAFIRREIPEINEKYGGDIDKYIWANRIDYSRFINDMRDEILYTAYLQNNLIDKINISPQEIRDFYEDNKSRFHEKAQVNIKAVTITRSRSDPEKDAVALERAREALKKINDGESFDHIVREYSDDIERRERGGSWGWVGYEDFASREIPETAFNLEVGNHSDIITTDVGYWIIKVTGKKEDTVRQIGDVWSEIERSIRATKLNALLKSEVDRLQRKHRVIMHNPGGSSSAN